ncbi:MAG: hypothetical protein RMK92_08435 [Armatimonadota bacterium]|nr:hypothetical protein [Armatimonadota bacterium]
MRVRCFTRRRGWLLLMLVPLVLWLGAGCAWRASLPAARVVQGHYEQPIGRRPYNDRGAVAVCGENGCHVAYEEEEEISRLRRWLSLGMAKPRRRVLLDGQPSPWFEEIVWMGFPFEDERFLFVARTGNKKFLYQRLQRLGVYDDVCLDFGRSRDGKTFAYAVRRGDRWFLVVNGRETPVPRGEVRGLVLSPDGTQLAYVAESGGKETVFVGGKPVGTYDGAVLHFVSNDGSRLVYEVERQGQWFLVVNGQHSPLYQKISQLSLGENGDVIAYVATAGSKTVVVWRGQPSPPYDGIGIISVSRDGKRLVYPALVGNRWTVVIDGQPHGWYEHVASAQVSEDGSRVAYVVQRGGQQFVVVDGKKEGPYDSVVSMLSPFPAKGLSQMEPPQALPETSREGFGYVARRGNQWFVVVNGRRYGAYEFAYAPVFRRDGAHFAFAAQRKGSNVVVVVDGKEGPVYDYVASGPAFRRDGSLEYLAVRGEALYRVTVPLR